jgi:hypothetical protein
MSTARLRFLAIALALVGSGAAISLLHARQNPPPWVVGDVFVGIGKGKYQVLSSAGALKETLTIAGNNKDVGGCWFDGQFNFYGTNRTDTKVVKVDQVTHTSTLFADTALQAPDGTSNSITMAVNGDVFVGNAGKPNGQGTKNLLRYRNDGLFLGPALTPALDLGGIDWIDMAFDYNTIFYTSRGRLIKRFVVGSTSQGNDIVVPGSVNAGDVAYAIRLLPPFDNIASGGLLVADSATIKKVSNTGAVLATYDANGVDDWRALNLDPDGVHFWAGGFASGNVYQFDLTTPAPAPPATIGPSLGPFGTGQNTDAMGLCVLGEPQTQMVPLILSGSQPQPSDVTAKFGIETAKSDPFPLTNPVYYSFSTFRLRLNVKPTKTVVAAVGFNAQPTDSSCPTASSTDFDCRLLETPPSTPTSPVCVPFFNNPSATSQVGLLKYQCGSYRLHSVPVCTGPNPATDPNCPFTDPHVPGSNDLLGETILDLFQNPPSTVFNSGSFGNDAKGSPRVYRDPDSINGNRFFDSTTGVIDWPALGSGTPNEYTAAQQRPETFGACAQIIGPNGTGMNSQSAQKLTLVVRTGPLVNGVCTGSDITDAATAPNNITLTVAGTGTNAFLKLYCKIAGNSNECFELNGQTYQANVKVNEIPPDTANPYIFAVTSTCVASTQTTCQVKFPPVSRQYFVCPNGSNCGS